MIFINVKPFMLTTVISNIWLVFNLIKKCKLTGFCVSKTIKFYTANVWVCRYLYLFFYPKNRKRLNMYSSFLRTRFIQNRIVSREETRKRESVRTRKMDDEQRRDVLDPQSRPCCVLAIETRRVTERAWVGGRRYFSGIKN